MDIESLVRRYPHLYHMAECGTWSTIKIRGLLSTTAVLDHYDVTISQRRLLESQHRADKVAVGNPGDQIVLRDQKPMASDRLAQALEGGITPEQWYQFINGKVFMWAEEHRLHRLLNARHYKNLEHDVLTIDTKSLIGAHAKNVWLCPMNSGNTFPVPHKRSFDTFSRINDYPAKKNGAPVKEVVEVVVDYSIPDIKDYVIGIRRMKGSEVLSALTI